MIGLGESDRKSGWVISRVDEFQVRVGLGSTLNPAQPAELQPYKTTNWNWRSARGEAPLLLLYLWGLGFIPCRSSPYLLTISFLFFSFKPNGPLVVCFSPLKLSAHLFETGEEQSSAGMLMRAGGLSFFFAKAPILYHVGQAQ